MTSTPTIEELWRALKGAGHGTLQRRVDAAHPLDLYAEFEPPSRPGLVAVCGIRPPAFRPLRSIAIEGGHRADGRWLLRLSLDEPGLLAVFAGLCDDIIDFTRTGVTEAQLGPTIVSRLDRWRRLFERDGTALGDDKLRGLIGELSVLERLLDRFAPSEAVAAWTGPLGTPQDFMLSTGRRIEVKAARRDARSVRINGLRQLDSGNDLMDLAIVRIEDTGPNADGALTAKVLVDRVEARIAADPEALASFRTSLAFAGWRDDPRHRAVVVRALSIDRYRIDQDFPRLTSAMVPLGIQDADYTIALPETSPVSAEIVE